MRTTSIGTTFLLAALLSSASAPGSAQQAAPAQQPPAAGSAGLGLDVSPAKIELEMPAGATYNMPMQVSNSGGTPVHVTVTPVDFKLSAKGEYQFLRVGESQYSLLKYAAINPREFDLAAGTTQQLRVSFVLPATGKPLSGEYGGVLLIQTRPERRAKQGVAISARVAAKVYALVGDASTKKIAGEIDSMTAERSPTGQVYHIAFRNAGNAHVYAGGFVEIRRGADVVEKIRFPENLLVERGSERLIEVIGKRLPAGQYEAIGAVDYGGPKLTGGAVKFTAQ